MEKIIPEPVAKQVREAFAGLTGPVEVLFFGKESGCPVCADTRQLLDEVTGLSDLLSLREYDLEQDAEIAGQYGITETPAFLLVSRAGETIKDYGVRFLGIPAGHEFSSLIHGLLLVSKGDSGLAKPTREFLSGLSQPVLLQVFTTPT